MARHQSAIKAARQSEKKRLQNASVKANFKTVLKGFRASLVAKYPSKTDAAKVIQPLLNNVQKILMKAASKNIIKKKTAARYISRMSSAASQLMH